MMDIPSAIFLSYAAQDEEAARRICAALRAAGLDVWFDQSELRGGDAWDASIRGQIKACALFMPIISASTEARGEGYFRLEWLLAVERSRLMADDQAFLMPVVIDDTPEVSARVPDRFRERQWSRLKAGATTPEFVEQVKRTLTSSARSTTLPRRERAAIAPVQRRWKWSTAVLGLTAIAALIVAALAMRGSHNPPKSSPAADALRSAAAPSLKAIAVLPFQNLTGRAEDAYLAGGLQEEILNALARMRALEVISRTSTSVFNSSAPDVREISRRLNVGSVLEGSMRRDGNAVRLTVQLIDARNDHHLLAANYDRDLGHIIGLQSEVARKVADALAATLTHYEQGELDRVATNNGDAYNLYLRAVSLWHQGPHSDGGVKPSIPLLGQALRLEPDYVDALALLSQAYTWSYFDLEHPEDGAHAKEAYERALQLDPDLPEARLARGLYQLYIAHDLDQALSDLTAVLKVRPNSAEAQSVIGLALRRLGRFDDAIPHLQRAWELDPLNSQFAGAPLDTYVALRRYPEALEQAALMQLRFPDWPGGYVIHGGIESFMQHSNEPLRRLLREHADVLSADDRANIEANIARAEGRYLDAVKLLTGAHFDYPIDGDLTIGMLYWAADRKPEAEARFHSVARDAKLELQRVPNDVFYVMPRLALAQSMLGEHAAALATIDAERTRAPESRDRIYGPAISFTRSVILVRAGRAAEGYAEVTRLLHVPFSVPDESDPIWLVVKDDPHYGELINRPPRL